MGHAQCGFRCRTPPLFQTQYSDDSGRFSVKTSTLHSGAHNSDSRGSSQAFSTPSLEAPQPSEVCSLGPQTSVCSSFYQRTLPLARNQVGILHSLAPWNRWTDRVRQPRVGPVSPALREQTARQLVWSLTYGGVPTQQPCSLCYPTAFIPARHWMTSSHGLQTPTEPFQSRDSQWIYEKDENSDQRSEICDPQGTGRHEKVLWLTQNSGSSIQVWRQSLPRHIKYLDYASFIETLASTAWPLCSRAQDQTYGLLPKAAT